LPPPASLRAGLRSADAALRFRSSGRSRYCPRHPFHTSEPFCPLPQNALTSCKFQQSAVTAAEMSATVTAFLFSPLRLRLRFGWSLRGRRRGCATTPARAEMSCLYPSASFAPARSAPERITPRRCRLIVTAWGWHRLSPSSPAVVHLRFAPDHFFRLRLRSPMPEERGHGERGPTKNLIGTLPPDPLPPSYAGEGAGRMLAMCSASFVGVILPGAYCPGTDHASSLPAARYCKEKQPPRPMSRAR